MSRRLARPVPDGPRRYRSLAAVVAFAAAIVVFVLANDLFRYHSVNHDEGVYLQQAAMLLEGRLWLRPPAGLVESFRPWFFVVGEEGLYPKYGPVPAAMYALGLLVGEPRLALAAVAAGNVALVYAATAAAFDRRTGALAAGLLAAAPLFLLSSAVFLAYAPTTLLNLAFCCAYVRAARRRHVGYAALAGLAAGLAFFARPYTATLFAAPFVLHALVTSWRALPGRPAVAVRHGVTAVAGLAVVAVALAYNAVLTGSPLLFPYEAFAPLDGLGFGRRRILGHELVYTPALALRANAAVLRALATDWFVAGPIGTALALVGAVLAVKGTVGRDGERAVELPAARLRLLFVGVAASVIVGNVYFWGNVNVLGAIDEPGDGFVAAFGPFYHFDLLLPLSAFAAHGALSVAGRLHGAVRERTSERGARVALVALLVAGLTAGAVVEAGALGPPIEEHAARAEAYEHAYAPIEERSFENALVFVPAAYGPWLNHPFQPLRNDPGFDGPAVYALDRGPDDDWAVVDALPDRTYYRYTYRGEWTAAPDRHVLPRVEPLRVREGTRLRARTAVGVPDRIARASVAVSDGGTTIRYDHRGDPPDALAVNWTMTAGGVGVSHPDLVPRGGTERTRVPITGADEVALTITITEPGGGTLTYREEVTVRVVDGRVEAVWPPESSVCTLVTDCGRSGTYLPDRPDTRPDGTWLNTTAPDDKP